MGIEVINHPRQVPWHSNLVRLPKLWNLVRATTGRRRPIYHQRRPRHPWITNDGTLQCPCLKRGTTNPVTRNQAASRTSWSNRRTSKTCPNIRRAPAFLNVKNAGFGRVSVIIWERDILSLNVWHTCERSLNIHRGMEDLTTASAYSSIGIRYTARR